MLHNPFSFRTFSFSSTVLFCEHSSSTTCMFATVRFWYVTERSDRVSVGTKHFGHAFLPCNPQMRVITHLWLSQSHNLLYHINTEDPLFHIVCWQNQNDWDKKPHNIIQAKMWEPEFGMGDTWLENSLEWSMPYDLFVIYKACFTCLTRIFLNLSKAH